MVFQIDSNLLPGFNLFFSLSVSEISQNIYEDTGSSYMIESSCIMAILLCFIAISVIWLILVDSVNTAI